MKQFNIEMVTYKDRHKTIARLREQSFQQQQEIIPELQDNNTDSTSIHLLAYLNSEPVGTVRIKDVTKQTAKIDKLAILPEFETSDLTRTIIYKALDIVKINGFETVLVLDRESRLTFYQELGFSQSEATFQQLGISYIKMTKSSETIENIDRQTANLTLETIGNN